MILAVIWTVQVLIYPQFQQVPLSHLLAYSQSHARLISWIVMSLMVFEVITLGSLWGCGESRSLWLSVATVALLAMWIQTFMQMVPLHQQLHEYGQPSLDLVKQLISLNWFWTIAWTIKSLALVALALLLRWPYLKPSFWKDMSWRSPLNKPNGISSWVETVDSQRVSPIDLRSLSSSIWPRIEAHWQREGRSFRLLQEQGRQRIYVLWTKAWVFPDIICFKFIDNQIHVRSQAMLGYSDFGYNRKIWDALQDHLVETL